MIGKDRSSPRVRMLVAGYIIGVALFLFHKRTEFSPISMEPNVRESNKAESQFQSNSTAAVPAAGLVRDGNNMLVRYLGKKSAGERGIIEELVLNNPQFQVDERAESDEADDDDKDNVDVRKLNDNTEDLHRTSRFEKRNALENESVLAARHSPDSGAISDTTDEPGERYLCTTFFDDLGLDMFQYATAYGIAKTNRMTLIVDNSLSLVRKFHLSAKLVSDANEACWTFRYIEGMEKNIFNTSILDEIKSGNVQLHGVIQSYKYFENVREDIRRQFTFQPSVKQQADRYISEIRRKYETELGSNVTLIGVHVRRGIKLGSESKQFGYQPATMHYIKNATSFFLDHFPNCVFIVGGQDTWWTEKTMATGSHVEYRKEQQPKEVDMAVMSSLDHIIITLGTFGWWCGYLTKGVVTYYQDFVIKDSQAESIYVYQDYFPPNWIPLT